MKKGIDIYNYERMFEATVRTMRASKITEQNKKLIEKFYNFCYANGIGKARVIKYVRTLRQLAEWLKKDFDKVTKQDVGRVVTAIQQRDDYVRDTDQKILEINGMAEEKERKKDELKPKICPRCSTINSQGSNYYSRCSSILDTETAMKEQKK